MKRNSFIEMAKLHNLSGRITYISSHAKQEHFEAAKGEYLDYKAAHTEWEKIYGNKVVDSMSIRDRLRQKEQFVKEREANRVHQTKQKDRGAR